jgi:mannosyltransferase
MLPKLFVTNFNRNFTGVSATAANVVRAQLERYDVQLVGQPLPGCPAPITVAQARVGSKEGAIWHVRRNTEMRAAIWARDVLRLPIKIVFTSAAQRRHSAYPRWLISRMDAIVATTDIAAAYVDNVRGVVGHGVATDVFKPAPDRGVAWATLGFGGARGIATIGRVRPEKGTDLFVDAMCAMLPRHEDTIALVIGKAAREHQGFLNGLKNRIDAAGMNERILFLGERPAKSLPALMQGLSLVMQLPRYEGYGMVPLEGMASAVPFVATDAGAYRAFSAHGEAGAIVDTSEQAANAAQEILSGNVETMGTRAREITCARFSAQAEADGIDKVYRSLF